MPEACLLVGDIGGTNARFALADSREPGFRKASTLACADYPTAEAAATAYLEGVGAGQPDVICIAAAGPLVDGAVRFTNNHWNLSCDGLKETFATNAVDLLNDFEAIAYAIPFLGTADCVSAGMLPLPQLGDADFTVGIIGPGTGLGAAGLLRRGGQLWPVIGEAGHLGFAAESRTQIALLEQLRQKFDRVSDERLVSGPGIENIHNALMAMHGEKPVQVSAAEVFARAERQSDLRAGETLQLFYQLLGQVAGNLALALGAWQGIYIAGGIVKRNPDLLQNSPFRSGFESKGRHRSLMERIPTQVIVHPEPGLLGASYRAARLFDARS